MLQVTEHCTLESLTALEPEWSALWAQDGRATPFQHPAWLLPWTRNLWGGGNLLVLAMRAQRRLVGMAPLFLWGYGSQPETVRVSWLGAGITDYTDLLAASGYEQACAAAMLARLREHAATWHVCALEELPPGSPLLELRLPAEPCSVCPVARLPESIEQHLAACDSKFRTDLRRAENRLKRAGTLEFIRADESTAGELMDHLFRLHAHRWQERGEAGVLVTQRLQQFHRETAAALLRAGMLRLYGLRLNGECIAVQYNIATPRAAYAYLAGFDPAWRKDSPGAVLLKHSLADAIAEGIREFDFLRQPEAFKYSWGALDRVNSKITLLRPGWSQAEAA